VGDLVSEFLRIALIVAAVVFAVIFFVWERFSRTKLIEPTGVHFRPFLSALGSSLCAGAALMVTLVDVELFAQGVLGKDQDHAAMMLLWFLAALPIGALVATREAEGPAVLFLLMVTVITSDTAQYYSGRAFGRRMLAPVISPKKTVEGAVGGFVCGALILVVAGAWWLPALAIAFRALLGVALVALGVAGDLFESMLKRSAGVKDSSTIIPGHGGVLDRIDALLFAAPVYYIVLKYA